MRVVTIASQEYEGMDEIFNNLTDVRLTTLQATTFDRIKFGPGREYLTSDKKYRVGKMAAALHFTHNGTEHDVAIVEQFRVQNDAPGGNMTYKDIPVQALALHPAEPGMGLGRYHAVGVAAFQTFVHVVPNYDRPAAPTTAGAANFKLDSDYREWLLNPFDCAGSVALMAHLWERDLLEVVV
ncbi:hypothetical protein H9P43_006756 [Blastocladiella emersonii ATCC 22665]|nr:hypothetical protein H9P43_006756 [Blastocladiella emersonii ATCC 22665]